MIMLPKISSVIWEAAAQHSQIISSIQSIVPQFFTNPYVWHPIRK